MRRVEGIACLMTMVTFGCGASVEGSATSDDTSRSGEALSDSLPPNTTEVKPVKSVTVDDCIFTVGTASQSPPYPGVQLAWVRMSSAPGHTCPATGYNVFGSSYYPPGKVDIARHPSLRKVVVDYVYKHSPSGSSPHSLGIWQISADDASILRSTELAALDGGIGSGYLRIDSAGNLFVSGEFGGTIPGTIGSGNNYVAYYQGFVFGTSPNPAPNAVVAFQDP